MGSAVELPMALVVDLPTGYTNNTTKFKACMSIESNLVLKGGKQWEDSAL
jgi:hypothetical protein